MATVAAIMLATAGTRAAGQTDADAIQPARDWIDLSSKVGVVAVVLLLCYLLVFSGRLRAEREVKALADAHERQLTDLREAHTIELAGRDARYGDLVARLEAVTADRDAWRLAAGNALEGVRAFERSTMASLEEKSIVVSLVDAIREVVQNQASPKDRG